MAGGNSSCPQCGEPLPPGVLLCPSCHSPVDPGARAAEPSDSPDAERSDPPLEKEAKPPSRGSGSPRASAADNPFTVDFGRRLARLEQWAEAATPLGVELPRLPAWAEEAASRSSNPEPWAEVVRAIERLAQKRISTAFDQWDQRMNARIGRLEAYAVDSRLEREQIEDALHAARVGDVAQALATFQQVDRVVALKERHLDVARTELERLVSFLKDLEALGLAPSDDSSGVATELEGELRAGRLAPLKQKIRALRHRAVTNLKAVLPEYVGRFGDRIVEERNRGAAVDGSASELARGARDVREGRPEVGVRRLKRLREISGLLDETGRTAVVPPP